MPISAIDVCTESHWQDVRTIIEESLDELGLEVELVSDADEVGVIQKRIIQNLFDNDIVVCDVSCKNPNVMFELGMRLAFDKPAVIIKDDITTYSFDTAPVEHLTYPRGLNYHRIQDFKKKLREKVSATLEASLKPEYTTFLKNFGKFIIADLEEKPVGKEEFILESLKEMRREIAHLRDDQQKVLMTALMPRKIGVTSQKDSSAEIFLEQFIKNNGLTKDEVKSLSDRSSPLFRQLVSEYAKMRKRSSEIVSPRMASWLLSQALKRFI